MDFSVSGHSEMAQDAGTLTLPHAFNNLQIDIRAPVLKSFARNLLPERRRFGSIGA
jgi:hypothetical protein